MKIKTNHTLFLFSLLLRLEMNCVAFSVFAASEILSTPFKSKKKEKKKLKLNKVDMKGGNKRWRKRRATARGIYSSNITPLMFPDME